jgi:hypothetical protein
LFSSWSSEGFHSMLDQIISTHIFKSLEVLLKICFSWLTLCTNSHSFVLIEVSWWASLEQMSTCLINTSNQSTDTEWSFRRMASLCLWFFGNFVDHSFNWMLTLMSIPVV